MTDNLMWGQYISSGSLIHRLDPRTKLLSVLGFTLCSLILETSGGYAAATILVGGLLLGSKIPFRLFLSGLKPILFILLFSVIYHLLLTREGIVNGIYVVWRILLLVSLASVLTWTTKPLDMARGLERLFKPLSRLGVPVEAFALMLMLAIRFISNIAQELDRIMTAQKARGYDVRAVKGYKRGWAYMQVVVPLLITTIGRAEQLAMTIDSRAYGIGKGRTSFRTLEFSNMDYAAGGVMLIFVLLILNL